jgi:threonine dehydratase
MDLRDIYAAKRRIRGVIRETPVEPSTFLNEMCGGEINLKLENQQLTGSFKIRGALNKLLQLSERERKRGIVAASSGNHAQGVGYAARVIGVEATVVVPRNTPMVKIDAIKRYGVELIVHGEEYMDAERLAREMERKEGKAFISPYNDLDVIAGQGTVGIEMLEEAPDLNVILVPVGGGGLISGIGVAYKKAKSGAEVIGVQSVASPVMYESVRQGRIVDMELEESVAEGLHGDIEQGSVTFDLCRDLVDEIVLVREESIKRAMSLLLTRQHQVVEGAGAVGVAAIMEDPERFRGGRVGVVVSGGNVDDSLMREITSTYTNVHRMPTKHMGSLDS